jgi:hypothetical protein
MLVQIYEISSPEEANALGDLGVVDERSTYGYRRVTALVNRLLAAEGKATANHKRVFRIMKRQGLLLQRHSGRRMGRLTGERVRKSRDVYEMVTDRPDIALFPPENYVIDPAAPWMRQAVASGKQDQEAIRRAREMGLDRFDETQTGTEHHAARRTRRIRRGGVRPLYTKQIKT